MAEKKKATHLILTLADIQAQDLESCTLEQLQIDLIAGIDIPATNPYLSSVSDDELIETVIKELLDSSLITPSKSSFASLVVVARGRGRAPRFCINLQ